MAMAGLLPNPAVSTVSGRNCGYCRPCAAARAPRFNNVRLRRRDQVMVTGVHFSWDSYKPCSKVTNSRIVCQASERDTVSKARKFQLEATELLAELLKASDVKGTAQKHVESLSEDFFIIASTYLDLVISYFQDSPSTLDSVTSLFVADFCDHLPRKAKKEGNLEVVTKIETTLQTALQVKEATLRPEIRLLNQLLRDTAEKDRGGTIQANVQYLAADSYFFQLLSRMISDVESQKSNPNRLRLLTQLRMINKETREVAKSLRKKEDK